MSFAYVQLSVANLAHEFFSHWHVLASGVKLLGPRDGVGVKLLGPRRFWGMVLLPILL